MPDNIETDWDSQDQSEVFDEDNQNLDGEGRLPGEMRTFEELPDLLDLTHAEGDDDDEDALIGEELDDEEIIQLEADGDFSELDDEAEAEFSAQAELFDEVVEPGALGGIEDVPLEFPGDIEALPGADESPAEMEADEVSDEDLDRLGYLDRHEGARH